MAYNTKIEKESILGKRSMDDWNNEMLQKIGRETNVLDFPHYDLKNPETYSIPIEPDKKITVGLFMPIENQPGKFKAHPDTIRALRKDIFVMDEELIYTIQKINCHKCNAELDKQFWVHCPFCGGEFD